MARDAGMSSREARRCRARQCQQCGTEFRGWTANSKFCSMKCRDQARLFERVKDGEAKCSKCKTWKPLDQFVRSSRRRADGSIYKLPHSHCKQCNAAWFEARRGEPRKRPYREHYKLSPEAKKRRILEANQVNKHNRRAAGRMPKKAVIKQMLLDQKCLCVYCGQDISDGYHIDHKTPVSRGGTNAADNLHLTCARCNISKGSMTHEEFLVSKRRPLPRPQLMMR